MHFSTSRRRGEDYRAANRLAQHFGVNLEVVSVPSVVAGDVADAEPGLYALMATMGAFYARRLGFTEVWTGIAHAVHGRRDTNAETLRLIADLTNVAAGARIPVAVFKTDRVGAFRRAAELDVLGFVLEQTHDCHAGVRGPGHVWGHGCGACPGCVARQEAWTAFETERGTFS
ncbi:7-cyano-7-deazaguanine synthase [compost metagenome]